MRRDGLAIATEEMRQTLAQYALTLDPEHRTLKTPYNGTFVFRAGASAEECGQIVAMAVRAVESEKSKHHHMTPDEEIATTL